jgi:hypothetical protein
MVEARRFVENVTEMRVFGTENEQNRELYITNIFFTIKAHQGCNSFAFPKDWHQFQRNLKEDPCGQSGTDLIFS